MKVKQKILAWILIGVTAVSVIGYTGTLIWKSNTQMEHADKIVIAKVNGVPIYKSALDQQMDYVKQTMAMYYGEDFENNEDAVAYYKAQQKSVLQYLIEVQVLLQQAAKEGIEISEKNVEEALELVKAQFDTEENFEAGLKEEGITLEDLKNTLKENLIVTEMITKYTSDVVVSEQEIEDYYQTYKDAYYTVQPGANMAHILVKTEDEAKEVKAAYEAGKSFEELSAKYGTDATKDMGGSLGYVAYDSTMYDADFLKAAKLLNDGEVSEPVKTQFGWHLIKVTDIKETAQITPLKEVKEEIYNTLLEEKQYNVLMQQIEEWKEQMNVITYEERLNL